MRGEGATALIHCQHCLKKSDGEKPVNQRNCGGGNVVCCLISCPYNFISQRTIGTDDARSIRASAKNSVADSIKVPTARETALVGSRASQDPTKRKVPVTQVNLNTASGFMRSLEDRTNAYKTAAGHMWEQYRKATSPPKEAPDQPRTLEQAKLRTFLKEHEADLTRFLLQCFRQARTRDRKWRQARSKSPEKSKNEESRLELGIDGVSSNRLSKQ